MRSRLVVLALSMIAALVMLLFAAHSADAAYSPIPPPAKHHVHHCKHGRGGTNQQKSWCQLTRGKYRSWGWGNHTQFPCLKKLWTQESGWNTFADNPYSGAYGIPQALPGSKMASAGADWQDDPWTQMRWGYGYIKSVYSTPCGAWNHEVNYGWY